VTSQEPHTQHPAADFPDTEVIVVARPAPVFVDSTGRRRRLLRRFAYGFGAFCMVYGGLISLSLAGGPVSPNAVLPFPDLISGAENGATEARPSPTPEPAVSAPKAVLVNEATPRRGNESTWRDGPPATNRSASRPSSSATPTRTVSPRPTTTRAAPGPTEATTTASPTPTTAPPRTTPPATTAPEPTPTTTTPPDNTGGTGGGTGSLDEGPDDAPVADVTTSPARPEPVVNKVPADGSGDTAVVDTPAVSVTVALPTRGPSRTVDEAAGAPDDAGEPAAEVAS
jgi:hypothetical protein